MVDAAILHGAAPRATPHARLHSIATASYAFLAFIVLAGTRPLQGPITHETGLAGKGSSIEALLYLVATSACVLLAVRMEGTRLFDRWMAALLILLGYAALTLAWSDHLSAGLVRWGQLAMVSVAVGASIRSVGLATVLRATYGVLVLILALDLVTVALVPAAVHGVGEPGTYPAHIPSWKGIHIHKNYAGPVAALTLIMASVQVLSGRWRHTVVAVAAALFLWQTHSTASQLAVVAALTLYLSARVIAAMAGPAVARFALVSLVIAGLGSLPFLSEHLAMLFNDPYALTGRIEVWNALGQYIGAHPWTGSGFGSFWRIGAASPILHLTDGWGIHTGQGHNGYLDVAVTMGLPGLGLVALILVIWPVFELLRRFSAHSAQYAVLFCVLIFAWIHNAAETSLLSGNHPAFFALLIGVLGLGHLQRGMQTPHA